MARKPKCAPRRAGNALLAALTLLACLAFPAVAREAAGSTPTMAPGCVLRDNEAKAELRTHSLQGQVVYVDFWASWCAPCVASFPFMNAISRELRDRGLRVLAINLDQDPEDAQRFLARRPSSIAIAADPDGACARSFGVRAMPTSYILDRQGRIRHVHRGFRPADARRLRAIVDQLLAE